MYGERTVFLISNSLIGIWLYLMHVVVTNRSPNNENNKMQVNGVWYDQNRVCRV